MAKPSSREALKQYSLRMLGKPVVEINVDDDQLEDRIDEGLQYFQEYHFDGVEKHMSEENNWFDIKYFKCYRYI